MSKVKPSTLKPPKKAKSTREIELRGQELKLLQEEVSELKGLLNN